MEFYINQLNLKQQLFCGELFRALVSFKENVKAPNGLNLDEMADCVLAVKYDYPELYYVNFDEGLYYDFHDHYEYRPRYHYCRDLVTQKEIQLEKFCHKINTAFRTLKLCSLYQKILFIHNILVRNCTYNHRALDDDNTIYQAYTIEGPIFDGTGVCLGVAMSFKYLCSKCCGANVIIARGRSLEPGQNQYERHAWNIITFGSAAAHIDVTWDMCITEKNRPIRYDYFFLSDIEMMRDHHFIKYPECRNTGKSYYEQTKKQFVSLLEMRIDLMHEIEDYIQKKDRTLFILPLK